MTPFFRLCSPVSYRDSLTCALRPIRRSRCARASWFAARPCALSSAGVEDIPNSARMRLKFFAACLNRLDPLDQVFGHRFLQSTQPICAVRQSWSTFAIVSGGENNLCYAKTGQISGRPGSVRRIALRVRHHVADLGANLVGRIGEPDRVAVAFGHAAAVEARQPRRFGQQVSRLAQNLLDCERISCTCPRSQESSRLRFPSARFRNAAASAAFRSLPRSGISTRGNVTFALSTACSSAVWFAARKARPSPRNRSEY